MVERFGLLARTASGTGVLHQLTGVIARHDGDIASVEILGTRDGETSIYFEIEQPSEPDALFAELRALPIVCGADKLATLHDLREAHHHHGRWCAGPSGGDRCDFGSRPS